MSEPEARSPDPAGDASRCPICAKEVTLELPAPLLADAPCPHCGNALLFRDSEPMTIALAAFATLDAEVLDRLRAVVRTTKPPLLLLDFDNVKVKTSAGYGRFLMLVKEVRKSAGRVAVRNVDPLIREMFVLTRIDSELEIQS